MKTHYFCVFLLNLFLPFSRINCVDYLNDQNSLLINQFLLNPESIVSNTEKLLAIAQYISKTLDANQTIEVARQNTNAEKKSENISQSQRKGFAKINANYNVKEKSFVKNKTFMQNGNIEGTLQVLKKTESTQFFAKSLKTTTLQSGVIYNQNSGIFIHGDVILGKVKFDQGLKATSFIVHNVSQWTLFSHDDFDQETHRWNFNKTSKCGTLNQNYFLGGHCNLASDEITKIFTNLPAHESVRVQATFHMFDNWQGEYGYMKINNRTVWKQNGYPKQIKTMDLCGNSNYDDPHMNLKIDEVLSDSSPHFTLTFGSNLNKNPCEASFAIDDVIVFVK